MNPSGSADRLTRSERHRRREFIRTHHPDVGGDPEAFRRGLQDLARSTAAAPPVRVVAVRSQPEPFATLLRGWRRRHQQRVAPRVR